MATLTVTITESLPDYNGADNDLTLTNALTISGVDDIYHRIITCPDDTPVTVATFHATTGASDASLDVENVKYIRVTNMDSSAAVVLQLQITNADAAADENAAIKVGAGESFLLGNMDAGIGSSGAADTGATAIAVGALEDLESIIVTAPSEVQVEMFVASVA